MWIRTSQETYGERSESILNVQKIKQVPQVGQQPIAVSEVAPSTTQGFRGKINPLQAYHICMQEAHKIHALSLHVNPVPCF